MAKVIRLYWGDLNNLHVLVSIFLGNIDAHVTIFNIINRRPEME